MAAKVNQLIYKKTGVRLRISQNHIRCFCHKVALILNSGLKALEVSSDGITKTKNSTLGYVPWLASICEQSEEIVDAEENNEFASDDEIGSDLDEADEQDHCNSDEENVSEETMYKSKNHTAQVLKKVCNSFLIITYAYVFILRLNLCFFTHCCF
jgi:cobalamin biosynthesis protein CobT